MSEKQTISDENSFHNPLGSSIRPNVVEVGRLFFVQDLNDEYSRTIAICVGSENARLVERALNALR
jgi:hypothetical protein